MREGERWSGNARPIQEWEYTYLESTESSSTLVPKPLKGLDVYRLPVITPSNLAQFSHRTRPRRLGIRSRGTPVPRQPIDTVSCSSSFGLVRVHVLRCGRPLHGVFRGVIAGIERGHA